MAISDIFKKKAPLAALGPEQPPTQLADVPLQAVITMQAQGLSNNQVIQTLQRQGYQPTQIYDALAQAEAKKSIEPMELPQDAPRTEQRSESAKQDHPQSETLVEQLVDEKWHEVQKEIAKMTEWKDVLTSRVDRFEQTVTDMKQDLDGLHKAIVSRIGEYDKTLMDVGTEIKAMEKVFQKVLPELTGNIQELSRITRTVKGPEKVKK